MSYVVVFFVFSEFS